MATPTATASLNKSAYTPGEVMVLTVNHADVDRSTLNVSGTVTDSLGASGSWSATAVIDAGAVAITNGGGKTWTVQSASRDQTVFTATA